MIYMHPVACIHPVRKRAEERSVDLLGDSKRLCVICLEEIGFSLVLVFFIDTKVSFLGGERRVCDRKHTVHLNI